MMTPEQYVEARLGPAAIITIGDKSIDLCKEVALPHALDVDDLLRLHPLRAAVWQRLKVKAMRARDRIRDELKEMESVKFIHYYKAHEESERQEWARHHGEEGDEERDDFGRRQQARARIAKGEKSAALRWRRNFSDDLVWAYVRLDDAVLEKRTELRRAQAQIELAEVLCEAMEHRARCLSHIAALHRDLGKPR